MHEFIRRFLAAHGGVRSREQIRDALMADPHASERLARTQGFETVLGLMKSSGFVEFDGDLVRRTQRRYGRRRP